jgi:hypothetical protein
MKTRKIMTAVLVLFGVCSLAHAESSAQAPDRQTPGSLDLSQTGAELQGLVSVGENIVIISDQLMIQAPAAGMTSFEIDLPKDVNLTRVQGAFIKDRQLNRLPDKQQLKLILARPVTGEWPLFLAYEKLIPKGAVSFEFPFLELPGVKSVDARFGVEAINGIEVKLLQFRELRQLDLSQVPEFSRLQALGPILFGFDYATLGRTERPPKLVIGLGRPLDTPVKEAIIDNARHVTLCQADGFCITKSAYRVRNKSHQFLRVKIPERTELWSAMVAGFPVRPGKDAAGVYLVPVLNSNSVQERESGLTVELTIAGASKRWARTGKCNLDLPETDVQTIKMDWILLLPDNYDYRGFESTDKALIMTEMTNSEMQSVKWMLNLGTIRFPSPARHYFAAGDGPLAATRTGNPELQSISRALNPEPRPVLLRPRPRIYRDPSEVPPRPEFNLLNTGPLPVGINIPYEGYGYRFTEYFPASAGNGPTGMRFRYFPAKLTSGLKLVKRGAAIGLGVFGVIVVGIFVRRRRKRALV